MYRAREDLEQSLAELKHVMHDKVDMKARARVAIERGKDKAAQAFDTVKERPVLVGSVIAGLVAAGVLIYVGREKNWW